MASIKKYNGSSFENAAIRKYSTASEIITPPTTIYADGSNITTYTIKGNTVQNGTPTPSNPVEVNGVGVRTENIYDKYNVIEVRNLGARYGQYVPKDVYSIYNNTDNNVYWGIDDMQSRFIACAPHSTATVDMTTTTGTHTNYGFMMPYNDASLGEVTIVQGSTAPSSYIPYGYKIPISTLQGTSNIYLSEPLYKIGDYADVINADGTVSRRIAKLTFNGDGSVTWNKSSTYQGSFYAYNALVGGLNLWTPMVCTHATWVYPIDVSHYVYGTCGADGSPPSPNLNLFIGQPDWNVTQFNQFLAENPVTVYYVLAEATTEQITLPTIPTTEGANSITVDTTVQPSEFTATWTGWHNAEVKEKSENLFDYEYYDNTNLGGSGDSWFVNNNTAVLRIPCKSSTTYTIKFFVSESTVGNVFRVALCNSNNVPESGNPVSVTVIDRLSTGYNPYTLTTSSDTKYILLQVGIGAYPNILSTTMIVEGSTAPSEFVPYWK